MSNNKVVILDGDFQPYGDLNPLAVKISDVADDYSTNDIEEASATVTYLGFENRDGDWYVKKIDTSSGNSFSHATVTNNSSYLTYDTAWAARGSLVYENFKEAF